MEKNFVESRCNNAISNLNLKEGSNRIETFAVCVSHPQTNEWHLPIFGSLYLDLEVVDGNVVGGTLVCGEGRYPITYIGAGLTGACICVSIKNGSISIYLDIPLEGRNSPCKQAIFEMSFSHEYDERHYKVEPLHKWLSSSR